MLKTCEKHLFYRGRLLSCEKGKKNLILVDIIDDYASNCYFKYFPFVLISLTISNMDLRRGKVRISKLFLIAFYEIIRM